MNTQKIAILGAQGELGRRLLDEALNRGHKVTAIVQDAGLVHVKDPNLKVTEGDYFDKDVVSESVEGHDVVISAHVPTRVDSKKHVLATEAAVEGTKQAGVKRLIALGHPQEVLNTPEYHESWKPVIEAQHETLKRLQQEKELNWSYAHTAELEPEKTSGKFRVSNLILLTNSDGGSKVPVKEYAPALLDEAEKSEYVWEESGVDI
jgi:putative NADH-flavin reductase